MSDDLMVAEARAAAARARLTGTVETLQAELSPDRLGQRALAEVKDGGERAARASAGVVKRHPGVIVGALGLASLLLGRRRIAATARRIAGSDDHKKKPAR